jgi:flagellar biosynthesis/type III secretory pathway protein FliH
MPAPLRPPAFLTGVSAVAGGAEIRPAFFTVVPAPSAQPLQAVRAPGARPGSRREPEQPPPAGATVEQLAALRAEALQRVAHAVEVLGLQAERLAEQARSDALELGFQVARRVLEAELSTSPEAFFALVRSGLKRAGDSRKIVVRVHPEDARHVQPALQQGSLGVAVATVEVLADPSLSPGDCVVDTDFGKVDGRLSTRLEELRRAVTAVEEGAA